MRADGTMIYLYEAAQAMTHGGAHVGTVHNSSCVALLALRRDGFVSVQADYIFPASAMHASGAMITFRASPPSLCWCHVAAHHL